MKRVLGLVCKRRVSLCPRTRALGCRGIAPPKGKCFSRAFSKREPLPSASGEAGPGCPARMETGMGALGSSPRVGACSWSSSALGRAIPCWAGPPQEWHGDYFPLQPPLNAILRSRRSSSQQPSSSTRDLSHRGRGRLGPAIAPPVLPGASTHLSCLRLGRDRLH